MEKDIDLASYVDQIIEDGIITNQEHDEFMQMVHADGEIDAEESAQISRIFKLISSGEVKVVDGERSKVDREAVDSAKAEALNANEELLKKSEEHQEKIAAKAECKTHQENMSAVNSSVKKVLKEQEENKNKIDEYFRKREE